MKKIQKRIVAVALSVCTCLSVGAFSACSWFEDEEAISAYEIAVKNGFQGTEKEWLASLKGATGKDGESLTIEDIYKASGFEGSLEEFIARYISEQNFPVQEDNDTEMVAKNTTSVVSICAGFQKDVIRRGTFGGYTKKTKVMGAEGSGVIVWMESNDTHASAYIVTNYHVVYGGSSATDNDNGISSDLYVYTYGAREGFDLGDENGDGYLDSGATLGDSTGDGIKATYVGGAMDYDIAILKVESSSYLKKSAATVATLGDSEEVTLGEKAFVIGNANGHGISVTNGLISVESETIQMVSTDGGRYVNYRVMRTDAAINHGNSGGGLFNAKGELIGITNAKNVQNQTDNMGYALPITHVKYVMQNIWDNATLDTAGYLSRAWFGIDTYLQSSVASLTDGKLKIEETFCVSTVFSDSQAGAVYGSASENNKLCVGDVIKGMKIGDGAWHTFSRRHQFADLSLTVRKGDVVTFKVLRENVETEVTVTFDKDEYFIKYA